MPLTTDDRFWVRSQIGAQEPPTDADLDAAFDRLGTALDVAVEILQGRYSEMLSGPSKWSVEGDFSIDATETIKALRLQLSQLQASQGTAPTMTVSSITRADPWR